MKLSDDLRQLLIGECVFSSSRSSGPGGQNVNKVNTKVELRFSIEDSAFLNPEQKTLLSRKLNNKINKEGEFIIYSQVSRSQLTNKQKCIEIFIHSIEAALTKQKKRIATKPSKSSKLKRLESKRKNSEKKQNRRNFDF